MMRVVKQLRFCMIWATTLTCAPLALADTSTLLRCEDSNGDVTYSNTSTCPNGSQVKKRMEFDPKQASSLSKTIVSEPTSAGGTHKVAAKGKPTCFDAINQARTAEADYRQAKGSPTQQQKLATWKHIVTLRDQLCINKP